MFKIATHSGAFHADDVFAVAVLQNVLAGEITVIRTRQPDILATCDYWVDVGGEYEPGLGRFDHHQHGFNERRSDGTPFAAAGLVWRHFGSRFVQHEIGLFLSQETSEVLSAAYAQADEIACRLDKALVRHLDAIDSGWQSPADLPASLPLLVAAFNPTWQCLKGLSPQEADTRQYRYFELAVAQTWTVLSRIVRQTIADVLAADFVRQSEQLEDGRIVVLTTPGLPWYDVVCNEMPEARFVVYPDSSDPQYQVRVVPVTPESFKARQDLPKAWAGLRDDDLAKVSGVADAVFCHTGLFIAGARSKEGAIALATAAL